MRRGAYTKRKVGGRSAGTKVIGIVYDGELTEDDYFRGWKAVLSQGRLAVLPRYVKSGGNPRKAVEEAVKAFRSEGAVHEKWLVCDVDDAASTDVKQAINDAKAAGINLCLSNRCFEIWIACHWEKSAATISNEAEAVRIVEKHVPSFSSDNKRVLFATLFDRTEAALANAEWLRVQGHQNPSTDVDNLVKKLFGEL